MKFNFLLFACSSVLAFNVYAQNNMGSITAPKFDLGVCNKLVPQIKSQADVCIKIKDQSPRQQCFDKIGQSIQKSAPNGACDSVLNPMKLEYMAKEKQLYAMQASAIGGQPGQPGQPGQMGQPQMVPAAVCEKLAQTIKPIAEECLKLKELPKRTQCFDKIGQEIKKVAQNGGCDKALDPIKHEIMSKEKQLYPTQTSALK